MTTCEYGACKHRSRRDQRRCQETLRNQRIVRLNTLISSAQQELAELMADRYRELDNLLAEQPDDQDAG
jgi:hypothetical protein